MNIASIKQYLSYQHSFLLRQSDEGALSSLSMLDRHQRLKNGDLSDNCFRKLTKLYLISAND
ncbi:hypothetical protein T07_6740 [Trichinella nelsoni]|uniref:Uncharacterized protein n=1 Tax=Trichinella nelsoni TaxID=6336 RepID=A0A0V0S1X2_9BILA|nr:hypothetical protein T07_6740 [Trichinella nelsoni]